MAQQSTVELRFDHSGTGIDLNDTYTVKIGTSVIPNPDKLTKEESQHKCTNCPQGPIFVPFGRFIIGWNTFLFVILLYSVYEIPFTIAFGIGGPNEPIPIIGICIDVCLMIDIVIVFRTAYIDKFDRLRIIHDPVLIANRYLKSWFFIDLLSCLPLSFIVYLISKDSGHSEEWLYDVQYFRLLRIIKLLRIVKIVNTFKFFSEHGTKNKIKKGRWISRHRKRIILTAAKHLFLMVMVAHYFACFWYWVGEWSSHFERNSWIQVIEQNEGKNVSKFVKYSYSYYWAIVTLFTTGYGDISAKNVWEQWTCCFAILVGGCLFAYFVGTLTMGLGDDRQHMFKKKRMEESLAFCAYNELPKELSRAITTHIGYYNRYNYLFDHNATMESLPCYLQKEVEIFLADSKFRELDMFGHLPKSIVGQIALKLKSKSVGAGKVLFEKDDIGKEIYIQRIGQSEVYIHKDQVLERLGRGDVIGENVILTRKRSHSVRCTTWSEFFVLNVDDIVTVLKENCDKKTAKAYWAEIKRIIQSTDYKDSHRHCRLKTIDPTAQQFEEYVNPKFNENASSASIFDKAASNSPPNIFRSPKSTCHRTASEKELEREDETLEQKNKKKSKYGLLGSLFIGRTRSVSRNERVMKDFGKVPERKLVEVNRVQSNNNYTKILSNEDCTDMDEDEDEFMDDNPFEIELPQQGNESQSGGFWHSETFDIDASLGTVPLKTGHSETTNVMPMDEDDTKVNEIKQKDGGNVMVCGAQMKKRGTMRINSEEYEAKNNSDGDKLNEDDDECVA